MSNDDLDLFDPNTDRRQPVRRPTKKRKKRRTALWVGMGVVLVLIAAGGYYGIRQIVDIGSYDDYAGKGESDVVIRVEVGDSTGDIAAALVDAEVVASSSAFVVAAETDDRVRAVQPGYYVMKTKSSGEAAVVQIVTPEARVGNLQITPGSQLQDITKTDGSVNPGIVSELAAASCAELNGESTCVKPEQLRASVEKGDLAKLGVPDWATGPASRAEPQRRLEGLIMPGVYDVRPGANADELWKLLVTDSATRMQAVGLPNVAAETGFTPYQVLTMASLIEREAIEKDFSKVSRVTYNRLSEGMRLQYDSTINYVLHRPTIRTDESDREKAGPYNTYDNTGLPPTPISAPSEGAVKAAVAPENGEWLFFVRCQTDGASCFAVTDEEHRQNRRDADARGAY
ncbi:endolytic transglycosylase MltG [Actinophytocola sediminis]